jgi:tetratricopeptide (TPR) repeat protein
MEKEPEFFQEDNDFQELLGRFENMLEHEQPAFFDVYDFERIIDHYLDRNHFNRAIDAVAYGVRQHPGSTALLIKEAQVYAEKGESQKALDMVHSLEILENSNPEVYLLKGMILNQLGKIRMAEKAFEKAIDYSFENQVDILYDIALSFEYVNQFKLAIRYLEKAHTKNPDKLNIINDLAYCYDRLHEFDKSVEYYETYLDREPYAENVWHNLGLLYFKKENFNKAVECFDFAIAINEEYVAAVFYKANALANLEDYQKAIQTYKDCIQLEPENVLAHCYLGESLEKLEKYQEAIEWYKKATLVDPSFSEAWYGIAVCHLFCKSYHDSLFFVNKAISLDEENPDFWFTLGNIQDHLNDTPEAIKAYARTTELDPYDDEAWIGLARLQYKQGHLKKAIEILRDSYSHTFDSHAINYYLSGYYYLEGNKSQALKFFEKGLALDYPAHVIVEQISTDLLKEMNIREILEKMNPNKEI